jgi:hypothetical protein
VCSSDLGEAPGLPRLHDLARFEPADLGQVLVLEGAEFPVPGFAGPYKLQTHDFFDLHLSDKKLSITIMIWRGNVKG